MLASQRRVDYRFRCFLPVVAGGRQEKGVCGESKVAASSFNNNVALLRRNLINSGVKQFSAEPLLCSVYNHEMALIFARHGDGLQSRFVHDTEIDFSLLRVVI